jgi:HlyD family secretion protein
MSIFRPIHLVIALLAVGLLIVVVGVAWLFGYPEEGSGHASEGPEPKVVLSGYADVKRGIASLYPLRPGRVEEVLVGEGQHVEGGAALLHLNDEAARQRVELARANLKAAQAQREQAGKGLRQQQVLLAQQEEAIDAAEHRLDAARHVLEHTRHLQKDQLLPVEQFQAAQEQVRAQEAAVAAERERLRGLKLIDPSLGMIQAEANVEAALAQLALAQKDLEERTLQAPAKGKVLRINVREGDVLGDRPREPAVLFAPDEPQIIRVDVEQEFADQVQVGDRATIRDRMNPARVWEGKVVTISDVYLPNRTAQPPQSLFAPEPRTLECQVVLDPGQPALRIGQRVRVALARSRR